MRPGPAMRWMVARWSAPEKPSVSPGWVMRLPTCTRAARERAMARATPRTSRFGIRLVNRLPGPRTIRSASRSAARTPGAGRGEGGSVKIRSMVAPRREMRDSPRMVRPSASRARSTTFWSVEGRIRPWIARTCPEVSIALR